MALKGKIEAIIYAAEEPITLEQIAFLMKEPVLQELTVERERVAAEQAEAESAAPGQDTAEEIFAVEAADATASAEESAVEEQAAPIEQDVRSQDGDPVEAVRSAADSTEPEAAVTGSESVSNQQAAGEQSAAEQARAEASETARPAVTPRRKKPEIPPEVKARVRALIEELISDCANSDRGIEVRHIAGGYRMATKPKHHDIVKAFAKSLKPPLRLSLPALETLAVVAYKQPVTAPEVGEIRGVDAQGVMATLLDRKLVTTAGRKAVIGRPILYKTTKEFLLRFGLNDISELPSMEEFEKLAQKEFFNAEEEVQSSPSAVGVEAGETGADEVPSGGAENSNVEATSPESPQLPEPAADCAGQNSPDTNSAE